MNKSHEIIGISSVVAVLFLLAVFLLPKTSATDKWENLRIEHCTDLFASYSKCIASRDETSRACVKYDELDALYVTRYGGEPFNACDPFDYGEVTP